jgi:hypothetical protein
MHGLTSARTTARSLALLLALTATAHAADVNDRLAVLVLAEGDPELSDNLTEVAISKLAQRRDRRLIGVRELREQLAEILDGQGMAGCLARPDCLARIGAAALVETALLGDVRKGADHFEVRLVLVDTRTARHDAEFSESVPAEMGQLIAVIGRGVTALYAPKKPNLQPPAPPGSPAGLLQSDAGVHAETPPRRGTWATPYGFAAGGIAVASVSAAVVAGAYAGGSPVGNSRAQIETDLERRERYASLANGLALLGGVLAISAIAAFAWHWHHH